MKLTLIFAALLLCACQRDELNISGRPVSEWVENLTDVESETTFTAYSKLSLLTEDQLKPYRDELRDAANKGSDGAADLLYTNFREVDIAWIHTYLRRIEDTYWSGAIDLLESDQKNHHTIVLALEKMEIDGGASLHEYSQSSATVAANKEFARKYLQSLGYQRKP